MQLLQWGASHDEETAVLNGQRGATAAGLPVDSSSTGRRRLCGRTLLEAVLVVGLLASTSAAIGLAVRGRDARAGAGAGCPPPPECLHALGGGPVNPGGGIGSATAGPGCKAALAAYAAPGSGAYWREVQLAADSAMAAFGFANASLRARSRAVTSAQRRLSSSSSSSSGLLGGPVLAAAAAAAASSRSFIRDPPVPDRSKIVIFDIDETVLSNMQQILHPGDWTWDAWVAAAAAPPLEPVLGLYQALCAAGFSVGFVTGRRESSRNHTAANLAAAGYGRPCADARRDGSGSSGGGDAGGGSSSGSSSSGDASGGCCYEALYLRQPNDTRLASVYKPWARQQLLAGGCYELLALVGDQFSDLNGEDAAPLAFKLPNPFYYIL